MSGTRRNYKNKPNGPGRRRHCNECKGRKKVWAGKHWVPCRFCSGHTR